jgi:methionyl aminopeptidase
MKLAMASVILKNENELDLMRESGRLLASVFTYLDQHIKVGISTMDINDRVEDFITNTLNARPASKGQYDFPFVLNTSINDVVCHGIPSITQLLKSGDIINVDITLEKNGFITDSSKMYMVGDASPLAQRLVDKTYEAMWQGIRAVKPGATLGDIGYAIKKNLHLHKAIRSYANTAATALAKKCMRSLKFYITENRIAELFCKKV